jgi:hypothetical protein
MLTALVLVCSLAATTDLADCNRQNALDVMRVPEEFASPVTCAMHGQAYLAETAIGLNLNDKEAVKVICVPSTTVAEARIRFVPDASPHARPQEVTWFPADGSSHSTFNQFVQSQTFQRLGVVPPGSSSVLEVRGIWYCSGPEDEHRCPQQAVSSMSYQVIDGQGNIVQSGLISGGMVQITTAGEVRVRVNDSYWADNYADENAPVQAALW